MLLQAINNLAIFQQPSFVQRLREAILYHYGATIGHFKIFFRFLEKKTHTTLLSMSRRSTYSRWVRWITPIGEKSVTRRDAQTYVNSISIKSFTSTIETETKIFNERINLRRKWTQKWYTWWIIPWLGKMHLFQTPWLFSHLASSVSLSFFQYHGVTCTLVFRDRE